MKSINGASGGIVHPVSDLFKQTIWYNGQKGCQKGSFIHNNKIILDSSRTLEQLGQ